MEKWDLLDNKRNRTGKYVYRGEEIPQGFYHQVVHICIFNKNNQMLIQKRSDLKNKWPGLWDLSCGGAAIFGEDTHQAASRELYEELGLSYDFSKDIPLLTVTYEKGFDDYFAIIVDDSNLEKIVLQKEEVDSVKWADLCEIKNMVDKKNFVPYSKDQLGLIFLLKDSKSYIKENR